MMAAIYRPCFPFWVRTDKSGPGSRFQVRGRLEVFHGRVLPPVEHGKNAQSQIKRQKSSFPHGGFAALYEEGVCAERVVLKKY